LTCVTFEPGSRIRRIEYASFLNCVELRDFRIPASVEFIGADCFRGCTAVSTVTFERGSKLKTIERFTFCLCTRLSPSIEIPASVEVIVGGSFQDCRELLTVTFESPSLLRRIEKSAFALCRSLRAISIPPSVTFMRCQFGPTTAVTFEPPSDVEELICPYVDGGRSCDIPDSVAILRLGRARFSPSPVYNFGRDSKVQVVSWGRRADELAKK
jgi:hypothetical protein